MAMLVEHKSTVFEISSFTEEIQISLLEDQCHIWFGGHWTGVSWRRTKTVYFLYCFIYAGMCGYFMTKLSTKFSVQALFTQET